ncbi:hypothetical protein BH10ACI1_BH10ACI1_15480 [soil metagenome]
MKKTINKNYNQTVIVLSLAIVLSICSACSKFPAASKASVNMNKSNNQSNPTSIPIKSEQKPETRKIKKPDFTMTAEEYIKEFTREGITDKDLEKYAGKSIAVTGRVKQFSFQPNGTAAPYITLGAAGSERVLVCSLDNTNVENRELIKPDEIVTMQGIVYEPKTWQKPLPLISCIVLKTD